jgi:diaminopimelate epimerase
MRERIHFWKATGAGNDFVLIDNRPLTLKGDPGSLARSLCSRHFGVGADGLILLEPSSNADFLMRYFNADGSSGGMCGNGGRCAARLAFYLGVAGNRMRMEALDFVYAAEIFQESVRLAMKDVSGVRSEDNIQLGGAERSVWYVDTGAPHAVLFADQLDSLDVQGLGKELRYHQAFAPAGANADFVKIEGASSLSLRTYERGVESETLACGTGAVAAAVAARYHGEIAPPVNVRVRSGETLCVDFTQQGSRLTLISLQGSARILFEGNLICDSADAHSTIVDLSTTPLV